MKSCLLWKVSLAKDVEIKIEFQIISMLHGKTEKKMSILTLTSGRIKFD